MTEEKTKNNKSEEAAIRAMRRKIGVEDLIDALEQHALGNNKMTATQVAAALALLRKTLPDLLSVPAVKPETPKLPRAHEDALKDLA